MKRQAIATALLALLAGPPSPRLQPPGALLAAGLGRSKAVFTCGTEPEPARRTEGRVDTWNFSALSFTPDFRGLQKLQIPYKSITRLEFGTAPRLRGDTVITPACPLKRQGHYLTIFYKVSADAAEKPEKERQGRQDRMDRKHQKDKAATDQEKAREKEKEHVALFELGEGVLRPTLRMIETRSGKRITYQNVEARKAAR